VPRLPIIQYWELAKDWRYRQWWQEHRKNW
jgi:hypothetical protein